MWLDKVRAALPGYRSQARILCYFNHYFGIGSAFNGKSTAGNTAARGAVVRSALAALRALPFDIDIRVCGLHGESLLQIDVDLATLVHDPQHIVYAGIEHMFSAVDDYDYFLNIEDDISISAVALRACMAFNAASGVNEVYLPNRMEIHPDGTSDCVDLIVNPAWRPALARTFRGVGLGVADSPHSALAFLSRRQMHYAAERVNLRAREIIVGGFAASAYANLHAPFLLWRARSDQHAHHVVHLDNWMHRESLGSSLQGAAVAEPAAPPPAGPSTEPAGYIDTVAIDGAQLKVNGWAVTAEGGAACEVLLQLGDREVGAADGLQLAAVDRPDAVLAIPHAQLGCGFGLALPVRILFELQDRPPPVPIGLRFRAAPDETFSRLPEAACVRGVSELAAAIATLPDIPDSPFMPPEVTDRIVELMRGADCYLEYGTGGTTMQALAIGIPDIVAVESDALWLEGVRIRSRRYPGNSRCHFVHADIGPTGAWGHPVSEAHWRNYPRYPLLGWETCREQSLSPDLVLIDGRFRVACSMASLLFARPGCRILIDDYADRSHYAAIERFVPCAQIVGRAAEFIVPATFDRDAVTLALLEAVTDPA